MPYFMHLSWKMLRRNLERTGFEIYIKLNKDPKLSENQQRGLKSAAPQVLYVFILLLPSTREHQREIYMYMEAKSYFTFYGLVGLCILILFSVGEHLCHISTRGSLRDVGLPIAPSYMSPNTV